MLQSLAMLKLYKENQDSTPVNPKSPKDGSLKIPKLGNKIHFISLGCPRNLVDSEVMLGILLQAGYEATEQLENADYLVINTCGFLEASRQESMDTVDHVLKSKKPGAKLIVAGCMVQTHSQELKDKFNTVDYYLGSGDVEGILKAVKSTESGEEISTSRSYLEAGEIPRQLSTPKHFAYLKIAEGCRKRCAYCIIPEIKGPLKSKTVEQIIKEFRMLRSRGVKEIILIAQDLGDFEKDIRLRNQSGLVDLLKTLLQEEGDYWLRLLYLYPDEITEDLLDLMAKDKRICPYLDMPIQHINDAMLKSMRRMTSKQEIISTIETLRKKLPEVSIRTSLIVGFPGETEEAFEELCQFLQTTPLDNVGIFKYSNEPKSPSYTFPDQVSEDVKQRRWDKLMQIQAKQAEKWNKRWVGKTIPVVVEGYHPETQMLMIGRHRGQCPDIDGTVLINDPRGVKKFGEVYNVKISDVAGYDLVGAVKN